MSQVGMHDVIVVGGGTAGVAAAVTLSESGVDVGLIESGPSDRINTAVQDIRRWQDVLGTELDFAVRAEDPDERIVYSAGRLLGGGSSLNNAWAFELPDFDLARWSLDGLTQWSASDIAPQRRAVSERIAAVPVAHPHEPSRAFLDATREAGIPSASLGGSVLTAGAGWVPLSAHGSVRRSSADAYLGADRTPPTGMSMYLDTTVRRLLVDQGRVVGVATDRGEVMANEVVLSCGALHTPRLLMVSGIGPADELARLGIDVVVHAPQVGRNLQDHPLVGVTWHARRSIPAPLTHGWEAAVLLSCAVTDEPFDLMLLCAAAPPSLSGAARDEGNLTIAAYLARPASRGEVRLSGPSVDNPVRVRAPYFRDADGGDLAALSRAVDVIRDIGGQTALTAWLGEECDPGIDTDVDEFVISSAGTMYHPTSTARMGSDESAVVSPDLRVRGIGGLRVADASVLPSVTTVPPYLTCLTVGERCAQLIVEGR